MPFPQRCVSRTMKPNLWMNYANLGSVRRVVSVRAPASHLSAHQIQLNTKRNFFERAIKCSVFCLQSVNLCALQFCGVYTVNPNKLVEQYGNMCTFRIGPCPTHTDVAANDNVPMQVNLNNYAKQTNE